MKLIYDNIVFAIQRYGGISVVWQELLKRIQQVEDVRYFDVDVNQVYNYSRNNMLISPESIEKTIRNAWISRYFPLNISYEQPFIFHSSYYRYCKNPLALNVTTVHDFTYEFFVKGFRQKLHTWQKEAAIRHSACVVCISENTKKDLLRLMPDVDESKIRVIYNGVSDNFYVLDDAFGNTQLPFSSHSYVLFVGRRDSYKNFELAVRAVAATSLNLLIVGKKLTIEEEKAIRKYLPASRYKCMSNVSDDWLNVYYNNASALIYPSSYEGFGLPVLEAQKAGCPVIAYNSSSIPEVIGNTPLLMEELTEECLIQKIKLLDDNKLMEQTINEGVANANRFSWDKMAQQYHEVYQGLL